MNKKILPAAVAAICTAAAVNVLADPKPPGQKGSGGGAPEYQFVDDNGAILGDVVYIEDAFTAWGYINDLSETSTIQVTATFNKSGRSGTRLAGNVKSTQVAYTGEGCSGFPYHVTAVEGLSYWVQGISETLPYPPFLSFLETEPVYYLPDNRSTPTAWTEVILDSAEVSVKLSSYNRTTDPSQCYDYDYGYRLAKAIDFGDPINAPVMPIFVVEK